MIKIENTEVYGFEAAIRGMRNPMNSWEKSDSYHEDDAFVLGKNDLALMKSLVKAGSDHSKFMRMITVTCDITAPLYFYKEWDTYKVGTVRNSCSTMHKIDSKEFTLDDFSHEHLETWRSEDGIYHGGMIDSLKRTIKELNYCREWFLTTKAKEWWYQMIQLLPSSYNQRSTVQLNYAVLRNIYHARKNHKLDEWHMFCKWVESLPYSEIITGGEAKE